MGAGEPFFCVRLKGIAGRINGDKIEISQVDKFGTASGRRPGLRIRRPGAGSNPKNPVLVIYIDKPDGIAVEDCEGQP